MIKVLIVDDEPTIRIGLEKTVPWEANGFTVAGIASNGLEALAFMEKHYTDIVISDIKMPYLDGLELLKRVHARYPQTPFIFISGHDEFEFARQALNNGAFAYVLKPIDIDELMGLLISAKDKYDLGKGDIPLKCIMKQNFYNFDHQWDFGGYEYLRDQYESCYFCTLNIRCRYLDIRSNLSMLTFVKLIQNTVSKFMVQDNYSLLNTTPGSIVVCIFDKDEKSVKNCVTLLVNQLNADLSESFPAPFGIWMGGIYKGISNVIHSYVESFSDETCLVRYDTKAIQKTGALSFEVYNSLFSSSDEILMLLLTGNIDSVTRELTKHKSLINLNRLSTDDARLFLRNLLYNYISALHESGQSYNAADHFDSLDLYASSSADEMFDKFIDIIMDITNKSTPLKFTRPDKHISEAKQYIDKNYSDPYLSLGNVAAHVNLNPSYLSAEFTKVEGICLIDYLTNLRIEKSKILLSNCTWKIADISESVGYMNSTYFSTLFKRLTGVTPSDYRKGFVKP